MDSSPPMEFWSIVPWIPREVRLLYCPWPVSPIQNSPIGFAGSLGSYCSRAFLGLTHPGFSSLFAETTNSPIGVPSFEPSPTSNDLM